MTSEIRTNSLKSRAGLSTVTLTDSGPIFSGITTFLDNSIFNVGNINATGVVTATTFVGNLTGNVTGNISGGTVAGSTGTFSGDVSITDKIVHTDDTNTAIRFPAADTFTVETNNTERFRIGSNGYIGVGNFSSKSRTDPLNVDSGIGTCNIGGNYIHLSRYSGGGTNYITAPQNNANLHISADDYISIGVDHSSSIYSHNIEAIRIDSSGRVLVNTTTTFAGDNTMIIAGGSPSGGAYDLYDGQLLITSTETSGAVNTGGVIQFYGHDGGTSRGFGSIRCLKENGTSGNHNAYMAFLLRANGSNPTERLRITSDGNIGAGGITSPLWTSGGGIHLNDNYGIGFGNGGSGRPDFQLMVTDGSKLEFRCGFGADTADIVMDTSGRLLVGTTSASISSAELFEVKSSGNGFSHFRNNSSGYAPIYIDNEASNNGSTLVPLITFTDGGGNRAGFLLNNSSDFNISGAGSVSFSTGSNIGSATERLRINNVGNVGISTNNPGYDLDLGGTVGNSQDNGSEYTLRIRSNHDKTAIRVGGGGGSSRVNLMRFDGDSNPSNGAGCSGATNAGAYGGTLVYHGDRSGNENSFAVYMDQTNNASQIEAFNIRQNGDYMHGGSSYSDRDQKENITAISGTALDKITQLSPKTWNWKPEYHDIPTDRIFAGFIAQEVQPHIPSIVTGTDGQGDMALDYQGLLAWTIKAVTELNSKVDTLEQDNIALRARVTNLEGE